jgi:dolichol kinase
MKKMVGHLKDAKKKIYSVDFDAHWYRRVFHTFGASFLIYYLIPTNIEWINIGKFWIPIMILLFALILEFLRIKGKIDSNHFFGLRMYEKNRVGSYLFFAVAIIILILFFPQQIALPCILCACLADPIMGEIRNNFGNKQGYIIGFFVCMFFFLIAWYKADIWVLLLVSIIGAAGAVIGEMKKFWLIDDDFMIQILPAILLLLLWIAIKTIGIDILPDQIIYPIELMW